MYSGEEFIVVLGDLREDPKKSVVVSYYLLAKSRCDTG